MPYEKLTSSSPEARSESPVPGNIAALAHLFPSVVQDGQVDFVALRTLLGDAVVDDDNERFGLHWHGKKQARQFAMQPSLGTLRPCKEESVGWDTTRNLYIEGDNLEVLKLLRKSYSGKVKMIYIDPPYNTGGDFVYKDNYQDSIANYKQVTGQEASYAVNTETSGRFHTNWLNFMLPRLMVARDLLSDDGVIFISIDENELRNLGRLVDEIFGENNFVECLVYEKKAAPKGVPPINMICGVHEYIMVYARNYSNFTFLGIPRSRNGFSNPDNDPRGIWRNTNIKSTTSEKIFPIIDPKTGNIFEDTWAFTPCELKKMIDEGRVIFPKSPSGQVRAKEYFSEFSRENIPVKSSLGLYDAQWNTEMLVKLMGGKYFQNPKHLRLMRDIESFVLKPDSLILDFFSGSATTAHAVMQLNAEDGGKRRFIMVQLPEVCKETTEAYKAGYKNICEIGKERIRRAGRKIKEEAGLAGAGLDVGFRVYKLDSSNVRAWNPEVGEKNLLTQMEEQATHLVSGRNGEDFLTEIMLKCGIDLTEEVTERKIAGHPVQNLGYGSYFACMDEDIAKDAEALALGIAAWRTEELKAAGIEGGDGGGCVVFVLDQAFDGQDAAKMNFVEILRQYGIDNVKAL